MRLSHFFFNSSKSTPQEASLVSHQLMVRSSMIKQTASGIYTWLPLGLRVLRKVEQIVRNEMNTLGAQELLMPMVLPADLWQESGRWQDYGSELLRLTDRQNRLFCLGPTHEEVIVDILRSDVQSYRQLPLTFFQIQTKFRDEIRPRFGVMRSREFVMKDAYSFHLDEECLEQTYQLMLNAYHRIFDTIGLEHRIVAADSGAIGGNHSHEFHILAESGEDQLVFSDNSDYCANIELAHSVCQKTRTPAEKTMQLVDTPQKKSIESVAQFLDLSPKQCVKLLLVDGTETPCVGLLLRGDHTLNPIKAEKHPSVKSPLTFVSKEIAAKTMGCDFGSLGPVHAPIKILSDTYASALSDFCCGANQNDKHYTGVNWTRDLEELETIDLRMVEAGDPSPDQQGTLQIRRGIEVGHIFQLQEKYSKALGFSVQNEDGGQTIPLMGCYGIGVGRIVAASIEQNHDNSGIIWPSSIAPWDLFLLPIGSKNRQLIMSFCQEILDFCTAQGIEAILDDRNMSPGKSLNDADLIGCPHLLIVSDRGLEDNKLEYQNRRTKAKHFLQVDLWKESLTQIISRENQPEA